MAQQLPLRLWLVLLVGTAGFCWCINIPLVNYMVQIALVVGFVYQAVMGGLPLTLMTVGVCSVLLYVACKHFFQDLLVLGVGTYVFEIGLTGSLLGWAVKHGRGFGAAIGWGAMPSLVVCGLLLANPHGLQDRFIQQIDQVEHLFTSAAATAPGTTEQADRRALYARSFAFFKKIFPAVNLVSAVGTLFIIYLVVAALGHRLGFPVAPVPALAFWRLPFWWAWVLAAGLSAALWGRPALLKVAGYNVLVGATGVFLVGGVAVLRHFFRARRVAPLVEYITYLAMAAAFTVSAAGLALVGLFDLWFDFRKLQSPQPLPKGEGK